MTRATLRESFDNKWIGEPNSGCWLWVGANRDDHRPRARYGVFRKRQAHHASWELHKGPVPEGLWVLHKCDTPACVNPNHLFLGTVTDNNRDTIKKGRRRRAKAARKPARANFKTECPRGHLRQGNTYVSPKGQRSCLVCRKLRKTGVHTVNHDRLYASVQVRA